MRTSLTNPFTGSRVEVAIFVRAHCHRCGIVLSITANEPLAALSIDGGDSQGLHYHPAVRAALKVGKKEANNRVERSLYQKANGYSYDAVKIFMPAGAKKPIYAPYVEHVPPSDVAAIFWMKNRDPANWRDAWQVEHTLGKYIISDRPMTEAQWIKERALVLEAEPVEGEATEVIEDKTTGET
jgi:hypothetical protein